jgi:hypothetical protein
VKILNKKILHQRRDIHELKKRIDRSDSLRLSKRHHKECRPEGQQTRVDHCMFRGDVNVLSNKDMLK